MKTNIENKEFYIELFKKYEIDYSTEKTIIFPIKSGSEHLIDDLFKHSGHPSVNFNDENAELFNPHVPEIKKYYSLNGNNIFIARDTSKVVNYEILYDNEIILPVLIFIGSGALTVGLNLLSNYIYDRYFNSSRKIKADILHFESESVKVSRYKIDGDADSVIKALKELKGE